MKPKIILLMWIPPGIFLMLYSIQIIRNWSSLAEESRAIVALLTPFFLLPVLFMCLSWFFIAWRITIEEKGLCFRNVFAQTKVIPFEDIQAIKIRENHPSKKVWNTATLYSKNEEKILIMPSEIDNFDILVNCLKKKTVKFEYFQYEKNLNK